MNLSCQHCQQRLPLRSAWLFRRIIQCTTCHQQMKRSFSWNSSLGFRICWIFIGFFLTIIIGMESPNPTWTIGCGMSCLILLSVPFLCSIRPTILSE